MNNEHEYKGYKIKIIQDSYAESPDTWGNDDCFLVYDHRQFTVKRDGFNPNNISDYLEDCHEQKDNNEYDNYYMFPVEAYIHSGVSLSLFDGLTVRCGFDSSVSGYILVKKDQVEACFTMNNEYHKAKTVEELAKLWGEGVVKEWNLYLSGEVYGYQIEKPEISYSIHEDELNGILDGNNYLDKDDFYARSIKEVEWIEIDSCWGVYGDPDGYILEEVKSIIDNYDK